MTEKTMRLAPNLMRGFTLIELMITVAIVAILAAVAYPAYTEQVAKGRRLECRGALLQSMQQQERFYTQFNRYAAFALTSSSPATKSFSGDQRASSACLLKAEACAGEDITTCVQLKASPQAPFTTERARFNWVGLTSNGVKNCALQAATDTTITLSNASTATAFREVCWP